MGYLIFQNYIFEGDVSNLQKLQLYFAEKFATLDCFGCDLVNQNGKDILQMHIDSRQYYVPEFKELSEQNNVTLYYSCGSEMGGHDTNDYDEKYFKWKPQNLDSYGFRKIEIVVVAEDGTEKRENLTEHKYWTINSVKEYCKGFGRNKKVYFCLSEAYNDFDHDEIEALVKNKASIYEIYEKCMEYLDFNESQNPNWFSVTNDKDGKYFSSESSVIYID